MKTLEITNFSGRLTRILNGDLNSGLAKFVPSFGYDPFSKPMNLTWLEGFNEIDGTTDLVLAAKMRVESGILYIYAMGSAGKLYKIQSNSTSSAQVNSVVGISSVLAGGETYTRGASMEFFGYVQASVLGKLYVGGDALLHSINTDGSAEAIIGSGGNYVLDRYRPLKQFQGSLVFGNSNNIGVVNSTGTVTSPIEGVSSIYGQLSPSLPPEAYITDIDVSPDGNYLMITASGVPNENISTIAGNRLNLSYASNGDVYYWNGSNTGVTASKTTPSFSILSLQTYLDNNLFFGTDSFGATLSDGTNKILSLPNSKPPSPNATAVNGNFLTWITSELNSDGDKFTASLFYFGKLDEENPAGLWRVLKISAPQGSLSDGFITQAPLNIFVNNKFTTVNDSVSSVLTAGQGKHYFSVHNAPKTGGNQYMFGRFNITPTGTGTPQAGVYETQTQLFSKRIDIKQIRVYTEPTKTGNGFKLDMINSGGAVMTNGTFTYAFAAGSDETKMQGSLERINFNPTASPGYSLGIRLTNTGSTNMTIKKVEVDWEEQGK